MDREETTNVKYLTVYQKYWLARFRKWMRSCLEWNMKISEIFFIWLKRSRTFIPPNLKCHHFSRSQFSILNSYVPLLECIVACNKFEQIGTDARINYSYCLSTFNWMVHWFHRLWAVFWNMKRNYIINSRTPKHRNAIFNKKNCLLSLFLYTSIFN